MISGEIFDFVYQRISGRQYYSCCLFSDSTQISLMKVSMGTITSQMIMLHEIIFQGRWTGGIRCGLVVKMPGSQREFTGLRLLWISMSGLAWSLYRCAALWKVVYDSYAIVRTLGTILEGKGISSWFLVSISSHYGLLKRPKNPFLPVGIRVK